MATILPISWLFISQVRPFANLHITIFHSCIAVEKLNADLGCQTTFLIYVHVVNGQNFAWKNGIISDFSLSHIFL